jgi:hypothetical protein
MTISVGRLFRGSIRKWVMGRGSIRCRAVRKEHLHTLTGMEKLAMMYKKNQQWEEAEKLFV